MALDEPKESDNIHDVDGFQYIIDKAFLEKVQPIKIDFHAYGFKLDCGVDFGTGSGCGGCSSSGGCG